MGALNHGYLSWAPLSGRGVRVWRWRARGGVAWWCWLPRAEERDGALVGDGPAMTAIGWLLWTVMMGGSEDRGNTSKRRRSSWGTPQNRAKHKLTLFLSSLITKPLPSPTNGLRLYYCPSREGSTHRFLMSKESMLKLKILPCYLSMYPLTLQNYEYEYEYGYVFTNYPEPCTPRSIITAQHSTRQKTQEAEVCSVFIRRDA